MHRFMILWTAIVLSLSGAWAAAAGEVRVDADFPGGNIRIDRLEGDVVRLQPDLRDTAGSWFYWYFRVRGAAERTLRFEFTSGEPVGVRGPAVSTDGRTWRWLGAESGNRKSFAYRFPPDADEVRFTFTIPYLQANWEQFLAGHPNDARLRPAVLCQSRHGRAVECLYVGHPDRPPRHRVLLTARHHACESLASYPMFDSPACSFCRKSFGCIEAGPCFSKSVVTIDSLYYHRSLQNISESALTIGR
jgi:hypothetical protein